jgi:hypothetical protein
MRRLVRDRFRAAIAVAVVLHAASLVVKVRDRSAPLVPVAETAPSSVELEIDEMETPREPRAQDQPGASVPEGTPMETGRRVARSEVPPAPGPAGSADLGGGGAEAPYALDPRAEPGAPRGSSVDLGIRPGDWSKWADPHAQATTGSGEGAPERRAPAPISSTGGLREALEARDQELGLGPGGAVLSAVQEATHSEVAPQLGSAKFEITVLRTGGVEVKLAAVSSDVAGWSQVKERVAAALKRKPPRIDGGRNGVRLGIEVVARDQLPNGAPAVSEPPRIEVAAPSFKAIDESKEELARRNPLAVSEPVPHTNATPLKANVELPGVFVAGRGRVCGYRAGLTVLGPAITGGCDPSNIGAKPTRVVSTRIVSQAMF